MEIKTKVIRVRLSTLHKVMRIVYPRKDESLTSYMDRVVERVQ